MIATMTTAEEAVKVIKSGDRVFIHTAAATPEVLVQAMTNRHQELKNVEIISAHTEGAVPYADDRYADSFQINCFFVGNNIRPHVQRGRAHYIPVFLSEIPALFRRGQMPIDVALVTVSKPNAKGFCSLGCSVDISNAAIDTAKYVIAQINPNMPFVHGNGIIHLNQIHACVAVDTPLYEMKVKPITEIEDKIGRNIAGLVEDGATLQMGIGGIPNAALANLTTHKNLGIHTEMCSDGIIDLVEKGVINGSQKVTEPGKIVSGFAFGTRKIYDFIDHNPMVNMMDVGYVNDTRTIRQNPKVTAINSAIEIDLYGQVCADSIGTKHYSGVGGQMDFIRGATLSKGGKAILALPSRTHKGIPRIVPNLKLGASVVTTRAHVQYIVTEYGIASMYAKNLKERAKEMMKIAHPEDREFLSKKAFENYNIRI
ncbi:propionyl-CoA:succinate CoA transferase [Kordia sp. SMS9]|uniref:acetyl-CoA hydrolase/transferase family protein n=1 Tax=Kordia sp. SMS9 TaxID=2282170 RepID=UPI000E0CD504|nr:acetyl-CoA hydrolase/transferase C-terminal domain-containing protein [Kordia sp. SMS9]AXG70890.1 propionyl-CoA:succinate CoA transferase [Kordia sp. SMS9]